MKKLKNQNAFTLIEILASIVLLSIIIVSLFSVFPQMGNINNKTMTNLDAANVGKELLVEIKKKSYVNLNKHTNDINNNSIFSPLPILVTNSNGPVSQTEKLIIEATYDYIDSTYNIVITIYPNDPNDPSVINSTSFRKMTIDVKNTNNSILTTMHGYLQN